MTGSQLLLIAGLIYLTSYSPEKKVEIFRNVAGIILLLASIITDFVK